MSDTPDIKTRKKPGPKPRITVLERDVQAPVLDDPRYQKGIDNPFGLPSEGVRLKDPTRMGHWFNADLRPDRIYQVKAIGYDDVRPEDILDIDTVGSFNLSPSGGVVRGERGREILLSIPKAIHERRQLAKTRKNLESMRDMDGEKHRMLNAMAAKLGGSAAEQASPHVAYTGGVRDSVERIQQVEGDE